MKYNKLKKKHDPEVVDQIEQMKFYEFESPVGPLFTACLVFGENGTFLARGVSICSVQDGFNKKDGRNRAIGRAIKAILNMQSDEPIKAELRDPDEFFTKMIKIGKTKQAIKIPKYLHVKEAANHFAYKSEFIPTPTELEKELFGVQ